MDLSIIIVSFNTKDVLKKCLDSLFKFTKGLEYEVIVIDNDSKDGSVEIVKRYFPQIKLIINNKNQGFSKAVNQGIEISHGDYILILNSDSLFINNSIKKLVDFMASNNNVAIVGPKLLNLDHSLFYSCSHFSNFLNQLFPLLPILNHRIPKTLRQMIDNKDFYSVKNEVDYMWGACLMFRQEILGKLKGFDEQFFLYSEEEDFCYRAKLLSLKVVYYPNACVIHIGQVSSSKVHDKAYKQLYYSLYLFFKKHHSLLYAISFRLIIVILMIIKIFLYRFLSFAVRKKREIYDMTWYKSKLILNTYLSIGKKIFL